MSSSNSKELSFEENFLLGKCYTVSNQASTVITVDIQTLVFAF
jgi:hypothetical protein